MTVSTTSIPVLHSVEVAHLYPQVMLPHLPRGHESHTHGYNEILTQKPCKAIV
jgi:hypothetical protein